MERVCRGLVKEFFRLLGAVYWIHAVYLWGREKIKIGLRLEYLYRFYRRKRFSLLTLILHNNFFGLQTLFLPYYFSGRISLWRPHFYKLNNRTNSFLFYLPLFIIHYSMVNTLSLFVCFTDSWMLLWCLQKWVWWFWMLMDCVGDQYFLVLVSYA